MIPRRINGRAHPGPEAPDPTPAATEGPTCPKRCDIATPPEYAGGSHYVCVCCGTQFTWKGPP